MASGLGDRDGIGAQSVLDILHHEIHEGDAFSASHIFTSVADNANADILIITGDKELHLTMEGATGGVAYAYLVEEPTVTADGTRMNIFNRYRRKDDASHAPTAQAFYDPTSTGGTVLWEELVPGTAGNKSVGSGAEERQEWVLKPNSEYILRFTNKAGDAKVFSIGATWYEHGVLAD